MSEEKDHLLEIQEYIEKHYGELSFSISNAFLSVKEPVEIEIEGKKQRYFIPETVIDLNGLSDKTDLIFGVGGIGRAPAVSDRVYLAFTLSDDQGERIHHATTKLPEMNKASRDKAKKDVHFEGSIFSITGSIPDFPITQNGFLSMEIEFHLTDPNLIDLMNKETDGEIDNPAAVFSTELCRVAVRIDSVEE